MLRLAAGLEQGSEHPLAAAIVAGATRAQARTRRPPRTFESLTGKGVVGQGRGPQRRARQPRVARRTAASMSARSRRQAEALAPRRARR